jgi:hypothetical protein
VRVLGSGKLRDIPGVGIGDRGFPWNPLGSGGGQKKRRLKPKGALAQRRWGNGPTPDDEIGQSGLADWPQEVVDGAWTYPALDSRGNLRAVTDGSGGVLERRQVSATGRPWAVDPATGSLTDGEGRPSAYGTSLLTGHHWDPYTQWHYARHRWISPWTYARFISHSPLTHPVAELNYE